MDVPKDALICRAPVNCRLCVFTLARDKRDPRVEHCTAADVESRHGN